MDTDEDLRGNDGTDAPDAPALTRALQLLREGNASLARHAVEYAQGDNPGMAFDEVLGIYLAEVSAQMQQWRHDEAWLLERVDWCATLFRTLPMAAVVLDENLLIIEVNDVALHDLRLTTGTLRAGLPLRRLLPADHDMAALSSRLWRLKPGEIITMHDLALRAADASARCADLRISLGPRSTHDPRRIYVCTFSDRTDRSALERAQLAAAEAEQRRASAESASQAKTRLLSRVSHELRTPLNAVMGFSQLLMMRSTHLSDAERHKIQCIFDAGKHLLDLVDEILEINRAESGQLQLVREAVSLHDVVTRVVALHEPAAQAMGITLLFSGTRQADGQAVTVSGDRRRIEQVLTNLVTNAIKYNHRGGEVDICVASLPQGMQVSVRDTGIGMKPEQLAQMFEPFNRLGIDERKQPGFGLGLSIVQTLCHAMGAQLTVESQPGIGSVFSVCFKRD